MFTIRPSSPRFRILTLTVVLLCLTFKTVDAAPTTEKCTLTDLHKAIDDWRTKYPIVPAYEQLGDLLKSFEIIEYRLSTQCDGVKDHLTKAEHFFKVIEPATHIPPLKGLIKPVQQVGERLNIVVLKKPQQTVCQTVIKIRNVIKDVSPKFKEIRDSKLSRFILFLDATHEKLADALEVYERSGGNPSNCVPLFKLCATARELSDVKRKTYEEIKQLTTKLEPLKDFLNDVDDGVKKTIDFINDIFDGAAGEVLDGVTKLLNKEISLPIPRGAKERGVGVIPNCCPRGWGMQGGLCYKNCRSGYAPVLFTCVEKCKPGWTDIGVTCTRTVKKKVGFIKIPVPQFDAKHSYGRGVGRIPATFGNDACSCRRDKKYLEAGLCYNKCGRDHLSGYRTSFLTQCLDLRSTKLSILDLAKHLDIFKKSEKIPVLGKAVKAVKKLIDDVFAALSASITKALKIPAPPLSFPTNLPAFPDLHSIGSYVDFGVFDTVDRWIDSLLDATSCRNAE